MMPLKQNPKLLYTLEDPSKSPWKIQDSENYFVMCVGGEWWWGDCSQEPSESRTGRIN